MTRIRTRTRDIWDNKLFRMSWAYREWREIVDNLPPNHGSEQIDSSEDNNG